MTTFVPVLRENGYHMNAGTACAILNVLPQTLIANSSGVIRKGANE
jgi:hypothetical protein